MDELLTILRLAVGGILTACGAQKLFGWFEGEGCGIDILAGVVFPRDHPRSIEGDTA